VLHYAFVRYEDLLGKDGTENDEELRKIGDTLGLGEHLAPKSFVPHYTYSQAKQSWIPWQNLFGGSKVPMNKDRLSYRIEEQFMCAYREEELKLLSIILNDEEEAAAGYKLAEKPRAQPKWPLAATHSDQIWPAVAARCAPGL